MIKRICIIGPSNAGKSTLAYRLGHILSYPVYHLDIFHHVPGTWQARPKEEYIALHDVVIAEDLWIIEGDYIRSMPQRFARADIIIHMKMERWGCLWRYLKRCFTARWRLAPRYGVSEDITDEFNWAMVKWIMCPEKTDEKWSEKQVLFGHLMEQYKDKVITLHSFADVNDWVKKNVEGRHT